MQQVSYESVNQQQVPLLAATHHANRVVGVLVGGPRTRLAVSHVRVVN